jgi:enoyl-CoA hydratase
MGNNDPHGGSNVSNSFVRIRLDEHPDGVRVLTLADPDKRNAIGPEMRLELIAARERLASDPDARCLVVTGEGKAFCAGADLGAVFDIEGATPSVIRARQLSYYEAFLKLRDLPYPTIAAVNGAAIGAGLNLALVCDITIAGPYARFGATFAELGLHPGGGCTFFLTQGLGPGRALRTLLLGRSLNQAEAYAEGLAEEIADDAVEAALTLAGKVAALSPALAQDMKRTVRIAASGDYDATVAYESYAQAATAFEPGVVEGIRAAGRTTRNRAPQ